MNKFLTLFFSLALFAVSANAQKGIVKGTIKDTSNKISLAETVVSLLNLKDTSSAGFVITDESGKFEIKDLDTGRYKLIFAVKGMSEQNRIFTINTPTSVANLGDVLLKEVYSDGTIVVATQEAAIRIKDDTIQFKADAFKTKPNANVEDLLKKLPGVEVNKSGEIKALGETVQKVYVDGKEFFGSDPKMATKNLQADMVDKVEIFDDMSDQAKFSKMDDGSRTKAINIKLKKDKKKGLFGKLSVGAGDNGTYDNSGNINYFKGDLKLSYIGQFNNVNKQGFSLQDIMGLSGSGMSMGGGRGGDGGGGGAMGGATITSSRGGGNPFFGAGAANTGISKSVGSGLNFVNKISKKVDLSLNYFYNNANTQNLTSRYTQQFFPNDSITNGYNNSSGFSDNGNHRINARLEWAIDSVSSLLIVPNITFQNGGGNSLDSTNTFTTKFNNTYLTNKSFNTNINNNQGVSANNQLLYRRKLNKPGRTLQIGLQYNINNSDRNSSNDAPFLSYDKNGIIVNSFNQNQRSDNENIGKTFVANASYTEPLGKNMLLEINGSRSVAKTNADRETKNNITNNIIPFLSNEFENEYVYNRVGANLRKQTKKYNYQLGMAVQQAHLTSLNKSIANPKIKNDFINIFPTARLNFNFTKSKNLRFDYRGRTNAPSISQLQNVPVVNNPLNASNGNPNLGQEFNHNLSINYTKFNMFTFKFIALVLNGGFTQNKISNRTEYYNPTNNPALSKTGQITTPENVNGSGNATAFIAYGSPVKGAKGLNININSGLIYNRDASLLFSAKNITNLLVYNQTIGANYNYKSKLDLGFNSTFTYNMFKNKLQTAGNTNYLNQMYTLDATYSFKNGLSLASDVDYFNQGGVATNSKYTILNASIAKTIFKKKNGEIKFSGNNLFNQDFVVNRSTGQNSITDTRNLSLGRYFMLSLTYNFSRFGGKASNGFMPKQFSRGMKDIRMN